MPDLSLALQQHAGSNNNGSSGANSRLFLSGEEHTEFDETPVAHKIFDCGFVGEAHTRPGDGEFREGTLTNTGVLREKLHVAFAPDKQNLLPQKPDGAVEDEPQQEAILSHEDVLLASACVSSTMSCSTSGYGISLGNKQASRTGSKPRRFTRFLTRDAQEPASTAPVTIRNSSSSSLRQKFRRVLRSSLVQLKSSMGRKVFSNPAHEVVTDQSARQDRDEAERLSLITSGREMSLCSGERIVSTKSN